MSHKYMKSSSISITKVLSLKDDMTKKGILNFLKTRVIKSRCNHKKKKKKKKVLINNPELHMGVNQEVRKITRSQYLFKIIWFLNHLPQDCLEIRAPKSNWRQFCYCVNYSTTMFWYLIFFIFIKNKIKLYLF